VNGCCIRLRRRTLFYLLVSASIALPSVDAFSNPAHKQAASHPSKAVKAENHKHRVGTQASHRGKTAKAENHKHQSQTEAKHSERALGPRILLPRDPTSAADSIPATPELAAINQAIRLIQQHKFSEATALTASINDPVAQKLVEWTYLRDSDSPAGFDRYNAFLQINPEWSSMLLRRRAEARLWQEGRGAATVRGFVGEQPVSALGRLAIARVMLGEGDRAGASRGVRAIWQSAELSAALESEVANAFPGVLTADDDVARMDRRIGAKEVRTPMNGGASVAYLPAGSSISVTRRLPTALSRKRRLRPILIIVQNSTSCRAGSRCVLCRIPRPRSGISLRSTKTQAIPLCWRVLPIGAAARSKLPANPVR
jgi:soluble lytic murein transglycosylase